MICYLYFRSPCTSVEEKKRRRREKTNARLNVKKLGVGKKSQYLNQTKVIKCKINQSTEVAGNIIREFVYLVIYLWR